MLLHFNLLIFKTITKYVNFSKTILSTLLSLNCKGENIKLFFHMFYFSFIINEIKSYKPNLRYSYNIKCMAKFKPLIGLFSYLFVLVIILKILY